MASYVSVEGKCYDCGKQIIPKKMNNPTENPTVAPSNCPFCGAVPKADEGQYVTSHELDCFFSQQYAQEMRLVGKRKLKIWNTRAPSPVTESNALILTDLRSANRKIMELQEEMGAIDKALYGELLPLSYEPDRALTIATIIDLSRKKGPACEIPPTGWKCTRTKGHDGPCAAIESSPVTQAHRDIIYQRTATDCTRCCIAMALNIPYEEVPDFVADHGANWANALTDWLLPRGMGLIIPKESAVEFASRFVPALVVGDVRPDGTGHCTFVINETEYDPKRGGKGLSTVEKVFFIVSNPRPFPQPQPRKEGSAARDGKWIDETGCCKLCDGEIPYGHSPNCDLLKLELALKASKTEDLKQPSTVGGDWVEKAAMEMEIQPSCLAFVLKKYAQHLAESWQQGQNVEAQLLAILDPKSAARLTASKTAFCMRRDGSQVTGFVVTDPTGHVGIINKSACRWLNSEELWGLMHPEDKQGQGWMPIVPIPREEGWYWCKTNVGWSCVSVRTLADVWHGLDPYSGKEHPLGDTKFWDHVESWHGPITLPQPPVRDGKEGM